MWRDTYWLHLSRCMVLPVLETESLICCLTEIRSLSGLKEECRSRFLTIRTVFTRSFLLQSATSLLWQLRNPWGFCTVNWVCSWWSAHCYLCKHYLSLTKSVTTHPSLQPSRGCCCCLFHSLDPYGYCPKNNCRVFFILVLLEFSCCLVTVLSNSSAVPWAVAARLLCS